MLHKKDFFKLGEIRKTHGVKGELMLANEQFLDFDAIKDFLFFNLEECLVPFRLESYRDTSDKTMLFICKGIDSVEAAAEYVGVDVFLPNADRTSAENADNPFMLIGYNIVEEATNNALGTISNFIDNPNNPLLEIENEDGKSFLLPFHEEFILAIENNTLFVNIPEGLLDLDD